MAYIKNKWKKSDRPIGYDVYTQYAFDRIEDAIYDSHTILKYGKVEDDEFKSWEDLRFDSNAAKAAGVKDPSHLAVLGGLRTYVFSPTTQEELYLNCQMPHSWDGSAIYPHVHWFATTASTNIGCRWGLEYSWASLGTTFATPSTIYGQTVSEATTVIQANKHYLTSLTSISPSTSQNDISSMLMCRLFRDATVVGDTFDQGAALLEFDIHYRSNGIGSKEEKSKT
jgi:hypothetical protein